MNEMVETENDNAKCPKCRAELHFVDKLGRHYCFDCELYFDLERTIESIIREEAEGTVVEAEHCPSCGEPPMRMPDGLLFCYSCETYLTEQGEECGPADDEPMRDLEDIPDSHEATEGQEGADLSDEPAVQETPGAMDLPEIESDAVSASMGPSDEIVSEETMSVPAVPEIAEARGDKEKSEKRICATCGGDLKYVRKHDRWYCYDCRKYAPKDLPRAASRSCPDCHGDAKYVEKYDRWYCWSCRRYLPKERESVGTKTRTGGGERRIPRCDRCRRPASWIAKYGRYYCHSCKRYLPRVRKEVRDSERAGPAGEDSVEKVNPPSCALCGRPTKYIEKYGRHYCYPCKRYAPAERK